MSVIYLVLPLALLIVLAAVAAFVWAARRGQYDDLDTPPVRMAFDDDDQGQRQTVTGETPEPPDRSDVSRSTARAWDRSGSPGTRATTSPP